MIFYKNNFIHVKIYICKTFYIFKEIIHAILKLGNYIKELEWHEQEKKIYKPLFLRKFLLETNKKSIVYHYE